MEVIRMRGLRRIALTALVTIAAPLSTSACRAGSAQDGPPPGREPRAVRAVAVDQAVVRRPIRATGTFGPKDEIALSFKIGGVVERVTVDDGARVRRGALLAALDLREIDAALAKARSAMDKAERDLARARRLHADSVMTLSALQDAETVAELARADLETAEFNRRYAEVVAPADGVVLRRSAEPGETVAPGAPVVVLGSRTRGAVLRVGLADRDVVRVRTGDSAVARFDAAPGRAFSGTVTEIAASATPGTGTYAVEVALAGAEALPAGLIGRVDLVPRVGVPTSLVPVEALLEADGERAVVFALSDDGARAERRQVTVSFLDGDRVAVAGGLEGVSSVVTDGAAWLADGDAVRVIR